MPIHFLDNYATNNLELSIKKKDGSPLHGEIWLYKQFLEFEKYNLLPNETWYLKHNYNLSQHPASKGKVEGQCDFLLLSKNGLLVIEIKGGSLRVDENDCYYSGNSVSEYQTQNPFIQAKEYTHTLKELLDSKAFVYRAVILPHEAGFELKGIQLMGYSSLFFSKRDFKHLNENYDAKEINNLFFKFISDLANKSKRKVIQELYPGLTLDKVNKKLFVHFPELKSIELKRLKLELFPIQSSYGYNPEKINDEIILEENYETLKGLRRNLRVLVQGAPGTGKTVLATKFLAENLLKQHKGIVFCANKLIRSKLEHIIISHYGLDANNISFRIFSDNVSHDSIPSDIDFLVFDEAQEYFDDGLYDFIDMLNKKLENPKTLILYDPKQSIVSNFKDLSWYADFFIEYSHYLFDEIYRCIQNKDISLICNNILNNRNDEIQKKGGHLISTPKTVGDKLKIFRHIIGDSRFVNSEKIILVHSILIEDFRDFVVDYYKSDIEELTEENINQVTSKIRFTTPLKYKGLENKAIYLFTDNLDEKSKVQNYVATTRAMESINIILWKK
jgi:hypothetical protein